MREKKIIPLRPYPFITPVWVLRRAINGLKNNWKYSEDLRVQQDFEQGYFQAKKDLLSLIKGVRITETNEAFDYDYQKRKTKYVKKETFISKLLKNLK